MPAAEIRVPHNTKFEHVISNSNTPSNSAFSRGEVNSNERMKCCVQSELEPRTRDRAVAAEMRRFGFQWLAQRVDGGRRGIGRGGGRRLIRPCLTQATRTQALARHATQSVDATQPSPSVIAAKATSGRQQAAREHQPLPTADQPAPMCSSRQLAQAVQIAAGGSGHGCEENGRR